MPYAGKIPSTLVTSLSLREVCNASLQQGTTVYCENLALQSPEGGGSLPAFTIYVSLNLRQAQACVVEILGIEKEILEQRERERRQMFAEDEASLEE